MCSFFAQILLVSLLIGWSVPAEAIPAPVLTNDMYSGTSTTKKSQQQKKTEPEKQTEPKKQTHIGKAERVAKKAKKPAQ